MQEYGVEQHDFTLPVLRVLDTQLELYPLLSLIDIYKSFFQDSFGPGHLLTDPESARAACTNELRTMKSRGRRAAESCGTGKRFCRVPMDLVVDGIIDEESYFSAFLAGTSAFKLPDTAVWKSIWGRILEVLKLKHEIIPDFIEDSEYILEMLEKGTCALHHSARYRRIYDPHYRIFTLRQKEGLKPMRVQDKLN
jgi:hypothetical protein